MRPENEKSSPGTRAIGKSYASGSPSARQPVDRRSARIAEPEQPGALVERLAGRVVERRAHDVEPAVIPHVEEERVPAAREQAEERRVDGLGLEIERGDVAVQVVDRGERQPPRPGERLRGRQPDEERADQPRALRDRDPLDPVEPDTGLAERLAQDGRDELEMPPRRDLRDDAAVLRVQLRLGGDDVGEDLAVVRDERRSGLVAGRLEPEDQALARLANGVAPHDQRVFSVVRVVAAADSSRAEAERLVEADRRLVRDAHLERVAAPGVVAR